MGERTGPANARPRPAPDPAEARDAQEFVARLRLLKERTGLTYRQLEQRAEARGDVLARSTVADVLRRDTLPRPEMLTAFLRACGAERDAAAWLRARERIESAGIAEPGAAASSTAEEAGTPAAATAPNAPTASGTPVPESGTTDPVTPAERRFARTYGVPILVAALSAAALFALSDAPLRSGPKGDRPAQNDTSEGRWATLRPSGEAELCVTEGRERGGDPGRAVAVLAACSTHPQPRTRIAPATGGASFVEWHHPEFGRGCLTVVEDGLLEPWNSCDTTRSTQTFRIEEPEDGTVGTVRVRAAEADRCWGLRGGDPEPGTEVVQKPCGRGADQRFVIRAG